MYTRAHRDGRKAGTCHEQEPRDRRDSLISRLYTLICGRRKSMVRDELLSFRQQFWPSHYPIEARYNVYGASAPSWTFTSQQMRTPEELRAFQGELARREQLHEW